LEPHLNGPFTPDLATPISKMKEEAIKNNWPLKIEVGLIGSSPLLMKISRAASIAKQVTDKKIKIKIRIYDHPGSEVVRYTIERDGFIDTFEKIGATGKCLWAMYRSGIEKVLKRRTKQSFVQP
jgi:aconitate hydratase